MDKNKGTLTVTEIETQLNKIINREVSVVNLRQTIKDFEADFKLCFMAMEKNERRKAFIALRDKAKAECGFEKLTRLEKSAVKTRLWRLGGLIKVVIGKTPKPTAQKPRQKPTVENGGSDHVVVLPEELSGKAPKEKSRGLKEVLSALIARTGWTKQELLAEITAILK